MTFSFVKCHLQAPNFRGIWETHCIPLTWSVTLETTTSPVLPPLWCRRCAFLEKLSIVLSIYVCPSFLACHSCTVHKQVIGTPVSMWISSLSPSDGAFFVVSKFPSTRLMELLCLLFRFERYFMKLFTWRLIIVLTVYTFSPFSIRQKHFVPGSTSISSSTTWLPTVESVLPAVPAMPTPRASRCTIRTQRLPPILRSQQLQRPRQRQKLRAGRTQGLGPGKVNRSISQNLPFLRFQEVSVNSSHFY